MDESITNVLLIEDNVGDARLVQEMLLGATDSVFELTHADRLSTGLERIAEDEADAILLDLSLPDCNGLDTFLRAHAQAPDTPIVVLTGTNDAGVALEAVHVGAQDYLVKGQVDGDSLARSIRYAIERQRLVVELEQTAAELELKNNELDAFAHTVSHDLKEPVRAVQAFSGFLLEDHAEVLDALGQDYLTLINNAANRMTRLIDDLLKLSQLGGEAPDPVQIRTGQVIRDIIEENQTALEEKHATVQIEENLPDIRGDRTRVECILSNLISNGLKFNKSAQPHVKVGVRNVNDGTATFYVQDNGIGIDPQHHDRIFGVFQRLHRREDYEGIGAGLSIVQRSVESLGGRVWVESEAGAGATFLFTVPLWREEPSSPKKKAA